ncbi:MAG: TRAP transporter large permease subunit [Burkholderiales bacterium]
MSSGMQTEGLSRLDIWLTGVTQRVAFLGVLGMLVIGILATLDVVVLRFLFNAPIPGSNEFLNTIFAVALAAVLASGLAQRATIEIDLLKEKLGATASAWLRALGGALYVLALALVTWQVALAAGDAYTQGKITTILQWKLWPFLWVIAALFAFCVPVQGMVFVCQVRDALRETNTRKILLLALGLFVAVLLVALGLWQGLGSVQGKLAPHAASIAGWMLLLLWVFILLLIPVSPALLLTGLVGTGAVMGFGSAFNVLGSETVGLITSADLAVIPLFLMMGAFASVSGMASDMYRLAHALLGPLRGGLAYATIGGCAGFGSISGTSMGTVATMGAIALPEMKRRGYSTELATGCITAGGTLGQLVPPGTAIVIYALLVEESIGRLYVAILIPALLTMLLYMAAVGYVVHRDPASAPGRDRFDIKEVLAAIKGATSSFILIFAVIGGILFGVFTATEAAAVGAVIAFVDALLRGKLGRGALWEVIGETTRSTSMIYFVIIGALMIAFFVGTSGLPDLTLAALTDSGMPKLAILCLLIFAYILLGTAMDGFTIMIITAPLTAAMIVKLGYDPIWWGVMMVVLVELGEVTPPFGMNLFMMKSLAPEVPIGTIFRGVTPFVVADCIKVALMIAFPALALWLPGIAFNK